MKVEKIKEGVGTKGANLGKPYIEYGFTKDDMNKCYNQYKTTYDREINRILSMNLVNKAQQASELEKISQKIKVEAFIPKIPDGLIDNFVKAMIKDGYSVKGVVKKHNGNFQVYYESNQAPKPKVELQTAPEQGPVELPSCPDCGKEFDTEGKVRLHKRFCKVAEETANV